MNIGENGKVIRIGLMSPLTGLAEMYGVEIVHAAKIACNEINESGGLLGSLLELVIEDDGSLPSTAVPAALRLVKEHQCVALIGNLLSNSRIAVANKVTEPNRIPYLNFSFYEGSISGRYFFHFAALPNQQIEKMIPFMGNRYGLKMFFAGNNYEWPRGSIDAAKRILKSIGGDIVGEEYLSIGANPKEIEILLEQVSRSGADVFVPYFAGSDQIKLLTRFTELGLKNRMAVVMGHYDEVMVSSLPSNVREGFYSSNTYFMSIDTPANKEYLQHLTQLPGITGIFPNGNGIQSNFGEGTYICVHAFANAVKKAGTIETETLVDTLAHIRFQAPQGEIEMDPITHHAYVNAYLSRCNEDGTFTIIEKFGKMPPVIPDRYQEQLKGINLPESGLPPQLVSRLAVEVKDSIRRIGTAKQILSVADFGILATDALGVILESNRSASIMFGYSEEELNGMSFYLLLPPHFRQKYMQVLKNFVEGEELEGRIELDSDSMGYRKDGSFFSLEASIAKVRSADTWMLVVTMRDITIRKKAEEEILRKAVYDELTGLPNRSLFKERLIHALERSLKTGLSLALLFVDLDGFKLVNNNLGHETGDLLLKSVAKRIMEQVRPGDTVGRLSGDEFVILCEQLEQPTTISALAERINISLRKNTSLFVTASIGIAIGHGSTHSADDLLRAADTAMYAVKEKGKDGWKFFNNSLEEQNYKRLEVIQGLRMAVQNNELYPRFQPIVSAISGEIIGAELLLRWNQGGREISPAVFIPIAEATGSILSIGLWVFRRGCEAEVEFRNRWKEKAPSYISINVSTRQLSEANLSDDFAKVLQETGANPKHILIEITETSLMADVDTNLRILRQLANLGLRVAVDDFGTGYSSLAQLTRMPVSVLKIDKAFVDGIETNEESRTVIRAIIGLGRALGLKLVAEGVEKETQVTELLASGCDFIQGYYFYRPMDEESFVEAVNRKIESNH